MNTAQIYKDKHSALGAHWVCRLSEPGGYVWHGQVAHTDFGSDTTKESFEEKCRSILGDFKTE